MISSQTILYYIYNIFSLFHINHLSLPQTIFVFYIKNLFAFLGMALKLRSLFSRSEGSFKEKSENLVKSSRMSVREEDGIDNIGSKFTPLSAVADAFDELCARVNDDSFDGDLDLKSFCDACSLVSVLFGCLGTAFKFAELEYCSKVGGLKGAVKTHLTLNRIIDYDIKQETVRTAGSLSRQLRRVRQGIDLIATLFQNFLSSDDPSLKEAASSAYAKTCAPYHTWAVRTAVSAGMYALPTREQLLLKLNETHESAEREMKRFIKASTPIIEYIDKLYTVRNISLDW
ncbi:ACD11 homolog protein-like [Salvia miltiorrhiza]|uniref:ACD11 homolog protein-like n=1 Tax=Salvia miltiorrhiza TaxID=226208 RepID=UPI0025AC6914|nr:ACD11 homolog protein-like [Salvia miltiorrhiza]